MGYNARNDEIRDNITRMRRAWAALRDVVFAAAPLDRAEAAHDHSSTGHATAGRSAGSMWLGGGRDRGHEQLAVTRVC